MKKFLASVIMALVILPLGSVSAMSLTDFRDRFNAEAESAGVPELRISIYSVENKIFDREHMYSRWELAAKLSPRVKIIGYGIYARRLDGVELTGEPLTQVEAGQFLTALGLIITVLNPDLDSARRREILEELKLTPERLQELEFGEGRCKRGGVEYTSWLEGGAFTVRANVK